MKVASVSWLAEGSSSALKATDAFKEGVRYACEVRVETTSSAYEINAGTSMTINGNTHTVKEEWGSSYRISRSAFILPTPKEGGKDTETPSTKLLQSIEAPAAITGLANGVAKTVAGLHLPDSVVMITDDGKVSATVTWSVGSSSYKPESKDEQTFTVQGIVALPEGVVNTDKVPLSAQVTVTVSSATNTAFKVRYNANGGAGTPPAEVTVNKGASYTILNNVFSREGHTLTGWTTNPSGGSYYAPGATFTVQEETTLYALWTSVGVTAPTPDKGDNNPVVIPPTDTNTNPNTNTSEDDFPVSSTESDTIVFTIDSKQVIKNGTILPEIDVPAMIINGRTMIPFRYFIETALGGVANFDATTYTITATVRGHVIVMTIDELDITVDGEAVTLPQAPTIVDGRTLVPLRMVDTIAQSVAGIR